MQIQPIDVTQLIATILGISIVLIPVIGLTARFALKPTVEALAKFFENRGADESLRILERRLELQEQEIDMLQRSVHSLTDGQAFERKLAASSNPDVQASAMHESADH